MALLTKRRQTWASKRGTAPTFKGRKLAYPAGVADRYKTRLARMVADMVSECERELTALMKSEAAAGHFAQDASIGSQARVLTNKLRAKFQAIFDRRARELAEQMVNGADAASTAALHSSLKAMSGGLSLKTSQIPASMKEALKAAVVENVSLIKTIASDYLGNVQRSVMRSITSGGLESLIPELQKQGDYAHRKAELVALDQTRKVFNTSNASRMKAMGVKKFEWIHSGGGSHPRQQHEDWDGQIFSFDNLPVDDAFGPVIPGQAINCRCTMVPVLEFEGDDDAA